MLSDESVTIQDERPRFHRSSFINHNFFLALNHLERETTPPVLQLKRGRFFVCARLAEPAGEIAALSIARGK
jgi:hypothetical protein